MMMDNNFERHLVSIWTVRNTTQLPIELFAATRNAFLAGWIAAGGSLPASGHIFEVYGGKNEP